MHAATFADLLRPPARIPALVHDTALVLAGTVLVALCARIAIPLPWSPVPVTAQTLAVILIGALLGSRRGAACLIAYLAQGAAGLPVFAGGAAGAAHLAGPTGGYLVGFVAAAWITGRLAERGWDRRYGRALVAMTLGTVTIFLFGVPWLGFFVGAERVLALGLFPFLPGAALKLVIAAVLLPSGWRWVPQPGEDATGG